MITARDNNTRLFLVPLASAAVALTAAIAADIAESDNSNLEIRADADIDGDNDDDGYSHYYIPHEGNSTLSATFSIRVTPEHYHMVSWIILWLCFASAVAFGMQQIRMERKWLKHIVAASASSNPSSSRSPHFSSRRINPMGGGGNPSDPELGGNGSGSWGGMNYTRSGGRIVRSLSRLSGSRDKMVHSASSASINSIQGIHGEDPVSSGDLARATFRRLLLTALISRTIAIPVQIYGNPLWIQLIADTFPVMAFATAWTWLVSFFVQLIGVALGMNIHINLGGASGGGANIGGGSGSGGGGPNNPSPSQRPIATINTVIQITAYVVYALLIISFTIFRRIAAAVLLYALLCCVHATLFGVALYFCPRLLGLLLPGLRGDWQSPLVLRLLACSSVCLLVFGAHTFSFAKIVVQSTGPSSHLGNGPYWWFQYGALELLPGSLFLILLRPKRATPDPSSENNLPKSSSSESNPTKPSSNDSQYPLSTGRRTPPLHSYHRRTDSNDSKSGSARMTPSPQPSHTRSPPMPSGLQQQQQVGSGGNSNKETSPLLSSHSNQRYGGTTPINGEPNLQQTGSD